MSQAALSAEAAAPPERSAFEAYRDQLLHRWCSTLTLIGIGIVPTSFALDWLVAREELWSRFLFYRLSTTAILFGWRVLLKRTSPSRYSFLHGYGLTLLVSGMVIKLSQDDAGFNSWYYAGINLVIVAANLMLPWRPRHVAFNGFLVVAAYCLVNGPWGGPFEMRAVVNNVYFLATTVSITFFVKVYHYRLIEQEFTLRAELVAANESLTRSRQELKLARDALWGEMEVAKRIQTALLPRLRKLGPYEVAAVMMPAAEVGGDYFDLIETRHGERWVCVGDVSGHGVESGLVMMMTQTSVQAAVAQQPGMAPSAVFMVANTVLWENISRLRTTRFMTLNVIRLDAGGLVVAGKHQDLMIYRQARGAVETVVNEGCWIGIQQDVVGANDDLEVRLDPLDVVLLFTDGLTEATDEKGELFGQDRLAQAFLEVSQLPLDQAVQALLARVQRFSHRQEDDMTVLMLRRPASQ